MRIFLIGFMGSGKTFTGARLAQQLSYPFVDLDAYIETQEGKSITQIFNDEGETAFRTIEQQALRDMKTHEEVVVSCGGGTPCFFDNMDWMKTNGKTVYLDLPEEILLRRLLKGIEQRPLIRDLHDRRDLQAYIETKLKERRPFYNRADIIFNPDNESLDAWIAIEHWLLFG